MTYYVRNTLVFWHGFVREQKCSVFMSNIRIKPTAQIAHECVVWVLSRR